MSNSIFVTGTNTGIGKTTISALLMLAAQLHRFPLHYFKPIQTGDESDCDVIKHLTGCGEEKIIKPVYNFHAPKAPLCAAEAENKTIDLHEIVRHYQYLKGKSCLVEGAGGLLVPLTPTQLIRDLIKALALPLLLVASTQLGTINHTLLTLEAAAAYKIPVKGVILVGETDDYLVKTLEKFTSVPILAEIPRLSSLTPEVLLEIARRYIGKAVLGALFNEYSTA